MDLLEQYLKEMYDIRSTGGGVDEQSYYPPFCTLLNEIGKKLTPKVKCVNILKNTGAGNPDFGLFTASQFKGKDIDPLPGQIPERGVIEAKPTNDDSWIRADGEQITKYWKRYNQVLVINYRDFVFVGTDDSGKAQKLEPFQLAESEEAFWDLARHPRKASKEQGQRFIEYLLRVMQYSAALKNPKDLAWFLASYAREARMRIEGAGDLPGLAMLRKGLEDALGLKFEEDKGEHFFRSTLIQTLFYGIFSSWVLWARNNKIAKDEKFDWRTAAWNLHVPMIAGLFEQIATPQKLKPLGIDEVLDWTGRVLNRVYRREFFRQFEEEHAVQYFYEPFLEAYDPVLRKELGVWYTPPEIVKYQVERIDTVLREELKIADGLADGKVYVLDPCCGTGAYLVETLKKIHQTLKSKGADALTVQQLKKAAMGRVFGFEILPAPFVISHLQIGLLLRQLGAPFSDKRNERAAIYLTNALTGWEPPKEPKTKLLFPEMQEEKEAAERVKRETPILVILGNPPYNAFAGTSPEEEGGLVDAYKEGLNKPTKDGGWGIKKFNLDDLYIRFFRIAERRIVKGGKGIVSYISSFSYLSDPSFVVMRENLLREFDQLWFDCMNGDSRETGKLTPEGKPDPSVFSTERNKEGIRVGTAICLLVRKEKRNKTPEVKFRHFWGVNKRKDLLATLGEKGRGKKYQKARPGKENKFSSRPMNVADQYLNWIKISELCQEAPFVGVEECRGGVLIGYEKEKLLKRLSPYFNRKIKLEELSGIDLRLIKEGSRYDPQKTRENILTKEGFKEENIIQIVLRPFDIRWCYHTVVRNLWNEPRPQLRKQLWEGNRFIVSRVNCQARPEGVPVYITGNLLDKQTISRNPGAIPLFLKVEKKESKSKDKHTTNFLEEGESESIRANLSEKARGYLKAMGLGNPDVKKEDAEAVWMHSLAIGYSPAYLRENADGIRGDWPRIPLPNTKAALLASAKLGYEVAGLLDTEQAVAGVTCGSIRREMSKIGLISRVGGGTIRPEAGELDITAGWGHKGKGNVCMPGKGRVITRPYIEDEIAAMPAAAREALGAETCDIYLNETVYVKNVPVGVWEYYIGGYQVIKKWLSYREKDMLGRGLTMDEARYIQEMVRRIAGLVVLQDTLDANYYTVKEKTYAWPA